MTTAPRTAPTLIDIVLEASSMSAKTGRVCHRLANAPHKLLLLAKTYGIRNPKFVSIVAANGQAVESEVPTDLFRFYASDIQVRQWHPKRLNAKKEPMLAPDGKQMYDESRLVSALVIVVPIEDNRFDALTGGPVASGDSEAPAAAVNELDSELEGLEGI